MFLSNSISFLPERISDLAIDKALHRLGPALGMDSDDKNKIVAVRLRLCVTSELLGPFALARITLVKPSSGHEQFKLFQAPKPLPKLILLPGMPAPFLVAQKTFQL